jgi:hyperosmotically inducible periplasmic protein
MKTNIIQRSLLTGVLAAVVALGANTTPTTAELRPLERQVRSELLTLPFYGIFDNLQFTVEGRTVTLLGQVSRPSLRRDAESAIQNLEGVEIIRNEIEVLPVSLMDDRLRVRLYGALFTQPALQRYAMGGQPSLRILVKNGHVALIGFVNSKMDRDIARIQAMQAPGVFSVDVSRLQVEQ